MDKRLILAVAGSGKTTYIVDALDLSARSLIVTYTQNNLKGMRLKIIEKFGFFPENLRLCTYFDFLYAFCFRPFLWLKLGARGIYWKTPPEWTMRIKRSDRRYYFDGYGRLYHNRIAKLLEAHGVLGSINRRLEKYCDNIFIDEVQDFAGHDFNFLASIVESRLPMVFVGDFYQHTFDTSRDGRVNANLHSDYEKYISRFRDMGLTIDNQTLSKSWRCSPQLCAFVSNHLGIEMTSHRNDETKIIFIESEAGARRIMECRTTVKLFYQKHYQYSCRSKNWGDSKGSDHYSDVCVVLNIGTFLKFGSNSLRDLKPQTKNKLYVACSRARNDLYVMSEELCKKFRNVSNP